MAVRHTAPPSSPPSHYRVTVAAMLAPIVASRPDPADAVRRRLLCPTRPPVAAKGGSFFVCQVTCGSPRGCPCTRHEYYGDSAPVLTRWDNLTRWLDGELAVCRANTTRCRNSTLPQFGARRPSPVAPRRRASTRATIQADRGAGCAAPATSPSPLASSVRACVPARRAVLCACCFSLPLRVSTARRGPCHPPGGRRPGRHRYAQRAR